MMTHDERVGQAGQRAAEAGLCATCAARRDVRSDRGTIFVMCGRSVTDPRFPRYPVLPVRACAGYEERPAG